MSRLTKKCGDWGYTVPGLNSVVKDNAEIIGKMTNKLAEYENLGSVEDLKGIHQANQEIFINLAKPRRNRVSGGERK